MQLEGVITNVANFGAFVDIGVHHDGLVHISHLADRFVKDPREVVKTGDLVKVRVLEVDVARQRIALSMRKNAATGAGQTPRRPDETRGGEQRVKPRERRPAAPPPQGAMADALARALNKRGG